MSQYYNPVSDITDGRVGRHLSVAPSDHAGAMRQLRPGEHLYALGDRLIFKQVVCLDDASEHEEYYKMYASGHVVSMQLLALEATAHQHVLNAAL